jgi:hypothetical protein
MSDLFDHLSDEDSDALKALGCRTVDYHGSPWWRIVDGRLVSQDVALEWLREQQKEKKKK